MFDQLRWTQRLRAGNSCHVRFTVAMLDVVLTTNFCRDVTFALQLRMQWLGGWRHIAAGVQDYCDQT